MKAREIIVLNEANKALDLAMEEFVVLDELDLVEFESENERNAYFHKLISESNKWKNENTQCMHNGCQNWTVKSHTIQKSEPLLSISENNEVVSPRYNFRTNRNDISAIHINHASVFPGFCIDHEKLFEKFEKEKDLTDQESIQLQVYRSVSREIFAKQNMMDTFLHSKKLYKEVVNGKFNKILETKIPDIIKNDKGVKFEAVRYSRSEPTEIEAHLDREIYKSKFARDHFLPFRKDILNDINKGKMQKIYIKAFRIDLNVPCCLSGLTSYKPKKKTEYFCITNILSYNGQLHVILASFMKYKKWIDTYVAYLNSNPFSLLSVIEGWMIYHSDHWFLKPSVWNNLSEKRKDEITKLVNSISYPNSNNEIFIFTELRAEMIKFYEEIHKDVMPPSMREILDDQIKRLELFNSC